MKIGKLSQCDFSRLAFRPSFCHGIEASVGAALVSGGTGLAGSLFGGMLSSESSDSAIAANKAEREKDRRFNAAEAEKQRNWASSEWLNQFKRQTSEWYNQQNYSNAQAYDYWLQQQQYNSPQEQVQRLNAAGMNPSAVANGQTFGSTGLMSAGSSVSTPSVPSGSAANIGTGNVVNASDQSTAFANIVGSVGSLIKNLASARRDGVETSKVTRTLDSIVEQEAGKAENIQLINAYQKIVNLHADKKIRAEIDNVIAEAMKHREDASYFAEKSVSERLNQVVLENVGKIKMEELLQTQAYTSVIGQIYDARVQQEFAKVKEINAATTELNTRSSANLATAENQRQQAKSNEQDAIFKLKTMPARVRFESLKNMLTNGEIQLNDLRRQFEQGKIKLQELQIPSAEVEAARQQGILNDRDSYFSADQLLWYLFTNLGLKNAVPKFGSAD